MLETTVSSVKHFCLTGDRCNRSTNKHGRHKALQRTGDTSITRNTNNRNKHNLTTHLTTTTPSAIRFPSSGEGGRQTRPHLRNYSSSGSPGGHMLRCFPKSRNSASRDS